MRAIDEPTSTSRTNLIRNLLKVLELQNATLRLAYKLMETGKLECARPSDLDALNRLLADGDHSSGVLSRDEWSSDQFMVTSTLSLATPLERLT